MLPIPTGPINTAPVGFVGDDEQHAALITALEAAGVELGTYDHRIVNWLAGSDWPTVAVITSLIHRAAHTTTS
ncbi:hypothetical protein [Streptomyces paludis]|uniref:Uncharacterized protein n=1 Tax=Streptomyces paludis TaxID=2282738 RepID=A0A345HSI5_9ACTN|nr:hypothetical protein [Streptomyces paludis]AXG79659.1 hypothetical protein DVK44_20650 [Streptomyces paludis]